MMKLGAHGRRCALALMLVLAGGCAMQPPAGHPSAENPHPRSKGPRHNGHAAAWPLAELGAAEGRRVGVQVQGAVRWFDGEALRAAWTAARRMGATTPGARPQFLLVDDPSANAFAMRSGKDGVIGIHSGMVELLGADEAAWAALIGHELAHLNLRHSEQRLSRRNETGGLVAIASVLLTVVAFPLTPIFAELATSLAENGYSRDDERAADEAGIAYMLRAGYDPAGAVRFFEKLSISGQPERFAFLATHPDSAERISAARALAEREPD
ncbi:M48 family metalloprotease [Aromatoleum petrolei]|uniref:M48 family metalloprotease n=1 Tax=Aromatoleum petrolei TaxID=76116 RepID=A0ABX1MUQ9_9RHOO|nr:M48 family metalloprotease [Aromatoleum petrolei]NMF90071.1 M48 family metalloprotease [Aromatoleum petrolei]